MAWVTLRTGKVFVQDDIELSDLVSVEHGNLILDITKLRYLDDVYVGLDGVLNKFQFSEEIISVEERVDEAELILGMEGIEFVKIDMSIKGYVEILNNTKQNVIQLVSNYSKGIMYQYYVCKTDVSDDLEYLTLAYVGSSADGFKIKRKFYKSDDEKICYYNEVLDFF